MIPYLPVGRPGGPIVLVYHGLGASKDNQHKELQALADAGMLAVGVDAVGHGERCWADFDERMQRDTPGAFLEMVNGTVNEIPTLIDQLSARFGAGPFGIMGISMGGFITFGAPLLESRLQAAVSILGSPDWTSAFPTASAEVSLERSPHQHPERFAPLALLALNAGRDTNVPPGPTRQFIKTLQPYYQQNPERLQYHEYPEAEHFMSEADWDDLMGRTVAWFSHFLAARGGRPPMLPH